MNVEKGGNGNGNTNTFQAVERDQLRWPLSIAFYALYHLPAHTHTLTNNWNVSHAASHGVI